MTKTSETRTRAAADLAQQLAAQTETVRGLALALETLTAAGDLTEAGAYNAAANRPQAAAVLQALADQLDRMQRAADQLEELATAAARLSPADTISRLCEITDQLKTADRALADDQSGAALCAAICPHRMPPEQLDQISDGSGAALPDQTGAGGAAR